LGEGLEGGTEVGGQRGEVGGKIGLRVRPMDTGDRVGMGSSHPPPTLGNRYHSAPHPAPLDDEDGGQGDEANQMGKKELPRWAEGEVTLKT